jgi:DNA polymerase (family 10)
LEDVVAQRLLREIPGVGGAIADIITKLHSTGNHPILRSMRKDVPVAVLEMLAVPGLRPDKVLKLYKELGLRSLDELEQAANADRLRPVKKLEEGRRPATSASRRSASGRRSPSPF